MYRIWPSSLLFSVALCGACGSDTAPPAPTPLFDIDQLIDVQIELAPADWDALRYQHKDFFGILADGCPGEPPANPFTVFPATVTIDGQVIESVGVRKKGFLGSATPTRPSLRLDFAEYQPGREFQGLERMTLNNNKQDASSMSTCLSLAVFRAAGVPAPRCNHARVTVNGEPLGVYSHVEPIKGAFLREHFGAGDGNLYEGTIADFRPGWVEMYESKHLGQDRADLQALVDALAAPDDALMDRLAEVVDIDAYVRFWAAEVLVGHWDGQSGNRNNHYVYHDPTDGRLHFIPWSPDDGFGPSNPFIDYRPPASVWANAELPRRLYLHPTGRALYQSAMRDLLDNVWDEAELLAEVDRVRALIEPYVHVTPGSFQGRVTGIRSYIQSIRANIDASLAEDPPWTHELPPDACLTSLGTIEATFSTTFGPFPPPNPFAAGSGTLDISVDGVPQEPFLQVGAGAGREGSGLDAKIGVAMIGARADGSVLITYMLADPHLAQTQPTLAVDSYDVLGYTLEPSGGGYTLSGFLRGTLTLDQISTNDGDAVSGSFSVERYNSL